MAVNRIKESSSALPLDCETSASKLSFELKGVQQDNELLRKKVDQLEHKNKELRGMMDMYEATMPFEDKCNGQAGTSVFIKQRFIKFAAKQRSSERGEMLKEGEGLFKLLGIKLLYRSAHYAFNLWKTIMLASMEEEAALEAHVADNQHVMDKLKGMISFYKAAARVAMERWKSYHVTRKQLVSSLACLQGDPDALRITHHYLRFAAEIGQACREHNIDELLSTVVDVGIELTGAELGFVFVKESVQGSDDYMKIAFPQAEVDKRATDPQRLFIQASDDSVLARGIKYKHTIVVDDVLTSEIWNHSIDRLGGAPHIHNAMCIPLFMEDVLHYKCHVHRPAVSKKMIAMLYFLNKRDGGEIVPFTYDDSDNIQLVCQPVAGTIDNHLEHCTQKQLVSKFQEVLEVGNTSVTDRGMDSLVENIVAIGNGRAVNIYILDTLVKQFKVTFSTEHCGVRHTIISTEDNAIVNSCVENQMIVNIPDAYLDQRFNQKADHNSGMRTKELMCVPIIDSYRKCIGAIEIVNSKFGAPFTAFDVSLLQGFSVYVLQCIAARELTDRQEATLNKMYLSMKASIVLSTSRHFGHTLERFFRLIMEQLKCSYVAVYIPTVDPSLMQRIDLNARRSSDGPGVVIPENGVSTTTVKLVHGTLLWAAHKHKNFVNIKIAKRQDTVFQTSGFIDLSNEVQVTNMFEEKIGERRWLRDSRLTIGTYHQCHATLSQPRGRDTTSSDDEMDFRATSGTLTEATDFPMPSGRITCPFDSILMMPLRGCGSINHCVIQVANKLHTKGHVKKKGFRSTLRRSTTENKRLLHISNKKEIQSIEVESTGAFSANDEELLLLVSHGLVSFVERDRQFKELHGGEAKIRHAVATMSSLNLEHDVEAAARKLALLLNAELVSIWKVDDVRPKLIRCGSHEQRDKRGKEHSISDSVKNAASLLASELPFTDGLIGLAWTAQRPAMYNNEILDLDDDAVARVPRELPVETIGENPGVSDFPNGYKVSNLLTVPIKSPGGRCFGVLHFVNKLDHGGFSEEDAFIAGVAGNFISSWINVEREVKRNTYPSRIQGRHNSTGRLLGGPGTLRSVPRPDCQPQGASNGTKKALVRSYTKPVPPQAPKQKIRQSGKFIRAWTGTGSSQKIRLASIPSDRQL